MHVKIVFNKFMNNLLLLILILFLSACQVKTQDASSVVAVNSFSAAITSTSSVVADGVATANITVTIKRSGLPWAGSVPTLTATGSNNTFSTCTSSNAAGVSTCTLKSTRAEIKSVSVASPAVSTAVGVTFIPDAPSSITSTISGTTPTVADGSAGATVTINIKDSQGNNIPGITPTFSATNTGSGNTQTACSVTNNSGISTCLLRSTKAEDKTLTLLSPVSLTSTPLAFVSGAPDASTSTITGTGPVTADGVATSVVTIILQDAQGNPVSSQLPIFNATDTGSGNTYGACSLSDLSGQSVCSFKSTKAEIKTLSLLSPVLMTGGTVTFNPGLPSALASTITGTTPVIANGSDASTITISIQDANSNPISGHTPTFSATNTGSGNNYGNCSTTDVNGISTCSLTSTKAETKVLSLSTPVNVVGDSVIFSSGAPSAANSTITGTSSVVADGVETSTITITLKDSTNNPIENETPTFSSTDTGSTNSYGTCSATNSFGVSTCTLASLKAETKILSITTPVIKLDGSAVFIPGAAAAVSSSISGTGPVVADGSDISTITVTLKDINLNLISGVTPTFSATDTGTDNVYGNCSSSDTSGVSTCTLKSSKAETKTLSLVTPVAKSDGTVIFTAGLPVAANSTISGTSPVTANGTSTSTISISLKDASGNPVPGETPTFDATNTGNSNVYGICSLTDADGLSSCTLASQNAELKTLSIVTPVIKVDGSVTFEPGAPVAANSTITATGPVVADGISLSTVTITLRDGTNNPVPGQTPTFEATDTNSSNIYGSCSVTDSTGVATCTLTSTVAETKTLAIATPVAKSDGTVIFTAGLPVAANSIISGTTPVIADNSSTSIISILLKDIHNNPVPGSTPTFSATDTGGSNIYGACSVTDSTGTSSCTLSSLKAEVKILSIATPVVKDGASITFMSGLPVPENSSIVGLGPVIANGSATSTVTVTLMDAGNNPVSGTVPTFSATDTGSTNTYGTCSSTNASGIATCTLSSLKAETKTLALVTPVVKSDGTVIFTAGAPVAANSTITGAGPTIANGTATSAITITLKDAQNNPVPSQTPTFSATDTGTNNIYGNCSLTNSSGISTCTLASYKSEVKTLAIVTPVSKTDGTVTFTPGAPVAVNSSISGTGPVVADGSSTSTISITLKDLSNNAVSGVVPTFNATDTDALNSYGICSSSDADGISTCTLASARAETKTLSLVSPITLTGSTVVFGAGTPVATNSTITGVGPIVANGSASSSITITLKDAANNPVSGEIPTFNATDSGSTNTYGTCSTSNASGIATCSLNSLKAETKVLAIATPVVKIDGSVTFTAGPAVAANTEISGTSPVVADGSTTSTVSITLRDLNNNFVSGIIPTFSATDGGANNVYGTCSSTTTAGISTCTLASSKAETKTLAVVTPVAKSGGTVTFTAGVPVAANSTISATGPVVADGMTTASVTITLKDSGNNPVAGEVPTFSASDTGSTNSYGTCSSTDASGVSSCTLTSLKAETKTLVIATPVSKIGGTVVFIAGSPVAANSSITGLGPIVADGTSTAAITITLKDAENNPVSGQTPTFSATDTSSTNIYGSCSSSDISGISTCTLASNKAEIKTLSIATPVSKTDGSVTFTSGPAAAVNSTILGTGPVVADGVATSSITITLKDLNNNFVSGVVPTFSATNTGSGNVYSVCSSTDASGVSNCTMTSSKAETKTLSIATPVVKSDGTVTFTPGVAVAANSTITGTGPIVANGTSVSTISITLKDSANNPVPGEVPTFGATDTGGANNYGACSTTNASGVSTCSLSSTKAETKTLAIATPVSKTGGTVIFSAGAAVALNSTITGTTSITADGSATSTVTITLKDSGNNPVSGETPTFTATDTNATNAYGACSATNASGVSTCTLTSLKAELKTLSIATPVIKVDGNVTFVAGAAVAATSSITGSGPVAADGSTASTISITLLDLNNNPVSGTIPTFSATDTGSTNVYGACSSSDTSGISTCTLKSTKSESKTLTIATPVIKAGGTVVFTAGAAVAANSTITGAGPTIANGTATSLITITLKDISNNPVSGQIPTFGATNTGSTNSYGVCSSSDASGISTCTLKSAKAESKTLSIATPVVKSDGVVSFIAGSAVAANSTITGTGSVVADGTLISTITITLKDISGNPVAAQTPTFSATNTNAANTYGACSSSDVSGIATCTLKSTKAETKTLAIATPVVKTGGTVVFVAGSPSASHSDISGTTNISADGVSMSFISIAINDEFGNPISGVTPIFNATDTDSTNVYSACSLTDATGVSTCGLASTRAEEKILQLTSPVAVTGSEPVVFSNLLPTAANSTISGTDPTLADGSADSTITITLRDSNNNFVPGVTPTFDATDTGTGNVYDACSMSDAGGVAICSMTSTKAEIKTLRITNPVTKSDGTVTFIAGPATSGQSTIAGTGPITADGVASSTITITLRDANANPVMGSTPTFSATNTGSTNIQTACSSTDASGISTCTLKSTKAENKVPTILTPVIKAGSAIVFNAGVPDATHSSIAGTGPVNPDGTSTSTITIVLKDAYSNNVAGTIPTFSATGTLNTYGACSSSTAMGESTCTLDSTVAETKTLSIATPVSKTGGTVVFESGSAVALNSSITGTGPVVADGVATSTVSVTLKDASNAAVVGIVPTFTASGSSNTYGICSATNSSGIATCALSSTKSEDKVLSIASPVIKSGSSVSFTAGAPVAANSTIIASTPTLADGIDSCGVTITLKDINNNPVSGELPTFSVTGSDNTVTDCTTTDTAGESTCSITSTKAEEKTVSLLTPVAVSGNAVDFNPNGINIQVPIELVDRGLASSTTAITFGRTRTSFNPEDYVAETNTFMLELVADNTNTTTTYTVYLVDSTGVTIPDSAVSIPPSTSGRRFNVVWTPNSSATDYRVRVPATTSANQVKIHSAKIIVEQTNAVATKLYFPLTSGEIAGENSSDASSNNANITNTTSTTYTSNTFMNQWLRNDNNYDTIVAGTPWTLETIINTSSSAGIASAALFDKTAGTLIAGSEVTQTGSTALTLKKASFSGSATNFNNGDTVELRIKSSSASYTTRVYKAGLWLKLKYLRKAEVPFRLAGRRSTSSSASLPDGRFLWDEGAWSNPTVFFQTNAASVNSSVALMDHGNADTGTSSATAVSTIVPASSTVAIKRSTALTLTNMDRYWIRHNRTSGTVTLGGAFLMIQATE